MDVVVASITSAVWENDNLIPLLFDPSDVRIAGVLCHPGVGIPGSGPPPDSHSCPVQPRGIVQSFASSRHDPVQSVAGTGEGGRRRQGG